MIELSGRYLTLQPRPKTTEISRASVRFTLPAALNNGNYFITARLEDRLSDNHFMPIDKQVGALGFNVMRPLNTHFMGVFHLPITAQENGAAL